MNEDTKIVGIVGLMILIGLGAWYILQYGLMKYPSPTSPSVDDILKQSQKFHFNQKIYLDGLSFNATKMNFYDADNYPSFEYSDEYETPAIHFIVENRMNESKIFEDFRFEIFQVNSTSNMISMADLIILDCEDKPDSVSKENGDDSDEMCGVMYDPETDSTYYLGNKVDGFTVTGNNVFVTKIPPHTILPLVILSHTTLQPQMENYLTITTDYQKTFLYLDK